MREEGSGTRSELEHWLSEAGLTQPLQVALELPSNEAVLSAVAAGRSVAALSHRAVASAVSAGWVRIQPLRGAQRTFSVLSDPRRHRTRAVEAMLAVLLHPAPGP